MINSYLIIEYEWRKPLSCTLNKIIIGFMDVIISLNFLDLFGGSTIFVCKKKIPNEPRLYQ